jgi:hypothetical protein
MKNLIQDTIQQIKKDQIKPEPKWKYQARKYSLWALFAAVAVLAAISFSAGFDNANNLDWDLYRFMHKNMIAYYLSIIPYFWAVLIALFMIGAFFEIRRTETGYRFSWLKIIGITLGSIVIFAVGISFLGFGGKFNSILAKNFPYYGQHMIVTKEAQWMQPEKGFLAGTIIGSSNNKLEIDDLNGKNWNIEIGADTLIRPSVVISPQETIKIIGEKLGANNFKAGEIRPWNGKGKGGGMNGQGNNMMGGAGNKNGRMQGN